MKVYLSIKEPRNAGLCLLKLVPGRAQQLSIFIYYFMIGVLRCLIQKNFRFAINSCFALFMAVFSVFSALCFTCYLY